MRHRRLLIAWVVVMAVVVLSLLLDCNLLSNEADKLPLALRQVSPQWLPKDWYLGWPQSHQWLFQAIAGWPLRWLGFPLGSLLDRLLGYSLWSLGFASVTRRLGLWPVSSALALALFLPRQGLVAGEWMVGGAESKTWAYGLLLLAFALWSSGRRLNLAALLAGLACSFPLPWGALLCCSRWCSSFTGTNPLRGACRPVCRRCRGSTSICASPTTCPPSAGPPPTGRPPWVRFLSCCSRRGCGAGSAAVGRTGWSVLAFSLR